MVNLRIKNAVGLIRVIVIFWADVLKVKNWYLVWTGSNIKKLWGETCADFVLNEVGNESFIYKCCVGLT